MKPATEPPSAPVAGAGCGPGSPEPEGDEEAPAVDTGPATEVEQPGDRYEPL